MVLYQCDRCKTEFKKKIDFTRHCKRKFPCQIKNIETNVNHGMHGTPPKNDNGSKMTHDGSKMTPNDSVFLLFFTNWNTRTPSQPKKLINSKSKI